MYCRNCGKELDDSFKVCPYCGTRVDNEPLNQQPNLNYSNTRDVVEEDSGNFGWALLGFLFPLVGLILFLVWHDNKPKSAKKAGIGALVGTIVYIIFMVIWLFIVEAIIKGAIDYDPNNGGVVV